MKINLLLSLIFIASLNGCDEKIQKPNCAYVLCASNPVALKIKYMDKDTNQDLLFENNSQYSIDDLKFTPSQETSYQPTVEIDNTTDKTVSITYLGTGALIQLGDLPADKINISYKALSEDCCAPYVITKLQVNDLIICEPCNDLDERVIILKK